MASVGELSSMIKSGRDNSFVQLSLAMEAGVQEELMGKRCLHMNRLYPKKQYTTYSLLWFVYLKKPQTHIQEKKKEVNILNIQ